MNCAHINITTGKIINLLRLPHETTDRNCFSGVPDTDVIFLTDAEADALSISGIEYSSKWNGTALVSNPDYAVSQTAETEKARIMGLKKKASELIVSSYPEKTEQLIQFSRSAKYLQMNMATRTMELLSKKVNGTALTPTETAEFTYLESVKTWTTSIRDMSNQAELNGTLVSNVVWPTKPTDYYV